MGRRFATLLVPALLCACLVAPGPAQAARPNIVVILTDDQRFDTVTMSMPTVQSELMGHGVTFTNAFVVNPLCCPSRATILTGRYSHSTGVYNNEAPYGGSAWFDDDSTIATWLKASGYRTGYMGKYLNGYGGFWAPLTPERWFVPPGWDRWFGFGGGYFNYRVSVDGFVTTFGATEEEYSTDVLAREAVSFLHSSSTKPFFLVYAPYAPHADADPPPRYATAFAGIPPWRPASFDEADVSDKPTWLRQRPPLSASTMAKIDTLRQRQLATQLAVDDGVKSILDTLRGDGRLENTMVVFLSDNGLYWGEHRLWKRKISVYEESIRVPLVIRYDAMVDAPRTNDRLVANVDLAPTLAALAGVKAPGAEGKSLLPLLSAPAGTPPPWRSRLLIEHLRGLEGEPAEVPTYCAVRTENFKYVVLSTHEEELYDLVADPAELVNRASDPTLRDTLRELRGDVKELCRPTPPKFDLSWLCTLKPEIGSTTVYGTPRGETICGRDASELLVGLGGDDTVRGGRGADRLAGGPGADQIDGGPGRDVVTGGPGSDIVLARDGMADRIECGKGSDVVYTDKHDRVARDCEQIHKFT